MKKVFYSRDFQQLGLDYYLFKSKKKQFFFVVMEFFYSNFFIITKDIKKLPLVSMSEVRHGKQE